MCYRTAVMSDEERDLARIRAWDRYLKAKTTCGAQKQRLSDCIEKFLAVAQSLSAQTSDLTGDELATMPTPIEYKKAVIDYKAAAADFNTAKATAKELGWSSQIEQIDC